MANIVFRCDASPAIGTGHVMRCLTLADALRQSGVRTLFLCRHLPDHIEQKLADSGHRTVRLQAPAEADEGDLAHSGWLGTSQQADARESIAALSGTKWDWLVVDHYALDRRWETPMRQSAHRLLAIDDIADRVHDCDALLDQNFYEEKEARYGGKVPEGCSRLLGPEFALLRGEFRQMRSSARVRRAPIGRVLVFFGGVDLGNFTLKGIEALQAFPELGVDVVIGAQHPARSEIVTSCKALGYSCHVQTDRMAQLMASADISIGAGGAASWERCCLGLPGIVCAVAANQVQAATDLAKEGVNLYIGAAAEINAENLRNALCQAQDSDWLEAASRRAMELVDGLGTERVANVLTAACQ